MIEIDFRIPGVNVNFRDNLPAIPRIGESVVFVSDDAPNKDKNYIVIDVVYDLTDSPPRIFVELGR